MQPLRVLLVALLALAVSPALGDVVFVDNSDGSPTFTTTGTWTASTANSGYYGINYYHNNLDETSTATYAPDLPNAGTWDVWALWTSSNNRETAVPYVVTYDGGTETYYYNQNQNGGVWQSLGSHYFQAGTGGSVTVSAVDNDGYVVADAIAFSQGTTADSGYIDPTTLTARASSYISSNSRDPSKAVNGAGMNDDFLTYHEGTDNGNYVNWVSASSAPADCWFEVDLGDTYQLGSVKVWNYTASNATTRGVQHADVYVSLVESPSEDLTSSDWTLVMSNVLFDQAASGSNGSPDLLDFGASGVTARWFALDILDNYGDSSYTGLAELRFYAIEVPEPGALALLLSGGLAVLGLGWHRRRRR